MAKYRFFSLKLHEENDRVIISRLDDQENKQDYIKRLIRADAVMADALAVLNASSEEDVENG